MRLKTYFSGNKHEDFATCVGWIASDEVVSCADDHKMIFWNSVTHSRIKEIEFPKELFPSDLHCYPKPTGVMSKTGKSIVDVIALGASNGKLHLISTKSERIEKTIDGHSGAVLVVRWSPDGSALASGGEDGLIKIWSKNGMLRSTLASQPNPIYCLCWSPSSDAIVFSSDVKLEIKPLSPSMKPTMWKGSDRLIVKVDWNQNNNLILSGGEDCRYKIWDNLGRLLFMSTALEHPVTSLNWSPDGTLFAIGSFNCLKLCDESGWTCSTTKPQVHSIFGLAWSNDSSQIAAAASNGTILFSHVIEKQIDWKSFEVTATARKVLTVKNISNNASDELEFKDNVSKFCLSFGHLVVITSSQCYVHKMVNLNTPHVFDLKDPFVQVVLQAEKHFLLIDTLNCGLYSYEGRFLINLKWPGMKTEGINRDVISLSNDTLAVRDSNDRRTIILIETTNGKQLTPNFKHKIDVIAINLDMRGAASERKCGFIDKNSDLYLFQVRSVSSASLQVIKLCSMMKSLKWNEDVNILSGFEESGKLIIWIYPQIAFIDRELIQSTCFERDSTTFGTHFKQIQIISFFESKINVRRSDGCSITTSINPCFVLLHEFVSQNKIQEALKLCRYLNDKQDGKILWSAFAAMAIAARQLSMAEIAYSQIERVDKVLYIQKINSLEDQMAKNGEMLLIAGQIREAENLFTSNGFILRVIMLHIELFNFDRALELAIKFEKSNPNLLKIVLYERKRYLDKFSKSEDKKNFSNLMDEDHSLPDESQVEEWTRDLFVKSEISHKSKKQAT